MSSETEIYAALSASVALSAIVSTKIYPDAIPEDKLPPAVVYQRSSTELVVTIGGAVLAEIARFAVTAWSATRAQADSAADSVVAALAAAGQQMSGRSAGIDPETGLFATTIDVDWFHSF